MFPVTWPMFRKGAEFLVTRYVPEFAKVLSYSRERVRISVNAYVSIRRSHSGYPITQSTDSIGLTQSQVNTPGKHLKRKSYPFTQTDQQKEEYIGIPLLNHQV